MKSLKKISIAVLTVITCVACCFSVACGIKWTDSTDSTSGSEGTHTYRYTVASVRANSDYNDYLNAKGEKQNKQGEFFDRTANFKAGDDNALRVMPSVLFDEFVDDSTIPVPCEEPKGGWNYIIKVSLKRDDGNFVELTAEEKTTYIDKLDEKECTIDFSNDAIGSLFEVSVTPDGLTDAQKNTIEKFTATMTVEVVEGYNVYDAKELSLINNTYENFRSDVGSECWKKFKQDNDISLDLVPNGIILQRNITITKDDLPEGLFFTEEQVKNDPDKVTAAGSLRDWARVYFRTVEKDENFVLEGNYFKLDASKIPLVVRPSNKIAANENFESHSSLFFIHADETSLKEGDTNATIRNMNLVGNSPRGEDSKYSGGIILMKSDVIGVHAYNTISTGWFIGYFSNKSKDGMLVEKCKGYDSYSSLFYVYAGDITVKDSEFIRAGGPAFIVDHVEPLSEDGGIPSSVNIIDSNIHSYIAGSEAWFVKYDATAFVSQIKGMVALFNQYGSTYVYTKNEKEEMLPGAITSTELKDYYIDLIAIYKSGDAAAMTADKITGYYNNVSNGVPGLPMDFGTYPDSQNPFKESIAQFLEVTAKNNAPAFITNVGGIGFTDGKNLLGTDMKPVDSNNALFKGSNLYLIYMRMGIVLGYDSLVPAQA